MANYVLVHGGNMSADTWNRYTKGEPVHTPDGRMGGRIWDPVAPALRAAHHSVFAPTLADEHASSLTAHVDQICALIVEGDLRDVVLAGHSYGGMVITGTAARMPERIRHMVYVDAALPDPGQSLFDIIAAGGRDPMSFAGLEAARPYVEKLPFDPRRIARLPKTYILCTQSDFSAVTQGAQAKIAGRKGWTCVELPSWHVPMANMPEEIARLLLQVAA